MEWAINKINKKLLNINKTVKRILNYQEVDMTSGEHWWDADWYQAGCGNTDVIFIFSQLQEKMLRNKKL